MHTFSFLTFLHSDSFHLFFCWIGLERLADFLEATQEIWERRSRKKMKINHFLTNLFPGVFCHSHSIWKNKRACFSFNSHLWVQVMFRPGISKWQLRDETSVNIHFTPRFTCLMFGVKKWRLSRLHHPLLLYFYYHSWLWWMWCLFQAASGERTFFNPSSKLQQTSTKSLLFQFCSTVCFLLRDISASIKNMSKEAEWNSSVGGFGEDWWKPQGNQKEQNLKRVCSIHAKNVWCCGEGYFGQKKFTEKVRKSRQKCVNRENR